MLLDQHWDGSFKKASQLGSLVMIVDTCVVENKTGEATVVDWKSKASSRICRTIFAGETMACGDALETCLYLRSLLLSFIHGRLVLEKDAGKYMDLQSDVWLWIWLPSGSLCRSRRNING